MSSRGLSLRTIAAVTVVVAGLLVFTNEDYRQNTEDLIDNITELFKVDQVKVDALDVDRVSDAAGALTHASNISQIANCAAKSMVSQRECGGLKVMPVDAAIMPNIALHTKRAWEDGHPALLTRARPEYTGKHRRQACTPARVAEIQSVNPNLSCDEYPLASTIQGGDGSSLPGGRPASTAGVPDSEQKFQAKLGSSIYNPKGGVKPGDSFLVIIVNPDKIPAEYATS